MRYYHRDDFTPSSPPQPPIPLLPPLLPIPPLPQLPTPLPSSLIPSPFCSCQDLWTEDLDALAAKLDEVEEEERRQEAEGNAGGKKKKDTKGRAGKGWSQVGLCRRVMVYLGCQGGALHGMEGPRKFSSDLFDIARCRKRKPMPLIAPKRLFFSSRKRWRPRNRRRSAAEWSPRSAPILWRKRWRRKSPR